jgi:hypothetical protein
MDLLSILSHREIALKRARSLGAIERSVRKPGRFMGARPNYGYQLIDLAPRPNQRLRCRGTTLQQPAPEPG